MPLPTIIIRHSEMDRNQKPQVILGGEIEIMSDEGRCLFSIRQGADGSVEISTGLACARHNGVLLDSSMAVLPRGNGTVLVQRLPYVEGC